ncbi:MAG: SLC13 family permease [Ruthenibacterium sp.]
MDIGLIALIVLVIVIALGFWKKMNVGLLAIAAATVLGYASGLFTGKEIIKGFSSSLFMTLLGVTFLFGVVQSNGCLEKLMRKSVTIFGKQVWMVPILMYIMGWVMSAIGPGCVPTLAFVAAVAIPLAHATGYNPIMLMMIGDVATYSGRFTPITPEGVLVTKLLAEQGYTINLLPMILNVGIGTLILSVIFFVFYKGYRVKAAVRIDDTVTPPIEKFTGKQYMALAGIVVMIAAVIFIKVDVGLASFVVAMVLLLLGVGEEKAVLKGIPWGTLLMVTGVGVLMNLVIGTGGIDMLATSLAGIMTPATAPALIGLTAGCMSWFSSTMGVVLPTLVPTLGKIAETVGTVTVLELVSVIGIVSSSAGFSPASTVGALIMAAHDGDPEYAKTKAPGKLFVEMFLWSIFCVLFLCVLALTGLFGIFK